jgi:protein-tyrosine phosphatase
VIDLHSHILPGLDDGVRTVEESVELARDLAARGTEAIAGTPHVRDDWPTSADAMERALAEVQAAVAAAGIAIRVLPGGELALDELDRDVEELRRFGLGGNPSYLLVETPYYGWPLDVEQRLFELRAAGITPVLAHPERNPEVQEDPSRVAALVRSGTLVQITAASLDGRAGRRAQAMGQQLIEQGLAHLVASDAHAPSVRQGGLDGVAAALGDEQLARWLTHEVPAAIVAGTPLPARPERTRRKKRFGLF